MQTAWLVALVILAANVPLGYWRAGVRKFSVQWFVAVHAAVPLVVWLRVASGLGWEPWTVPLFVAAYFGGQMAGGWLRGSGGA